LLSRGKAVYDSNCIACHAPDPTREGGLGPAVAGASLELLTARVVDGNYPPGYTPKRDTRVMVALPFLEPELPALAAYLGSLPDPEKK
jgi:mono/diheme cytochrome c family protein